jgi:hypothetical protein
MAGNHPEPPRRPLADAEKLRRLRAALVDLDGASFARKAPDGYAGSPQRRALLLGCIAQLERRMKPRRPGERPAGRASRPGSAHSIKTLAVLFRLDCLGPVSRVGVDAEQLTKAGTGRVEQIVIARLVGDGD